MKDCQWCGSTFEPRHGRQIYCSLECAYEAHKWTGRGRRPVTPRSEYKYKLKTCLNCNKLFVPHHSTQKYCDKECYRLTDLRKRKEKRASIIHVGSVVPREDFKSLVEQYIDNMQGDTLSTKRLVRSIFQELSLPINNDRKGDLHFCYEFVEKRLQERGGEYVGTRKKAGNIYVFARE